MKRKNKLSDRMYLVSYKLVEKITGYDIISFQRKDWDVVVFHRSNFCSCIVIVAIVIQSEVRL